MFIWRTASDSPEPAATIAEVLPWLLEAGQPYYGWLFGGRERALRVLDGWMRRPSSEVSILRMRLLVSERGSAGGFIALTGGELAKARKADVVALATEFPASERRSLMLRLACASNLFAPVADDEYYLSKMGVSSQFRGMALGRVLVERYLEEGAALGYQRFRLDVHADNEPAIRCYRSAGFMMGDRRQATDGTLPYCSMQYDMRAGRQGQCEPPAPSSVCC